MVRRFVYILETTGMLREKSFSLKQFTPKKPLLSRLNSPCWGVCVRVCVRAYYCNVVKHKKTPVALFVFVLSWIMDQFSDPLETGFFSFMRIYYLLFTFGYEKYQLVLNKVSNMTHLKNNKMAFYKFNKSV